MILLYIISLLLITSGYYMWRPLYSRTEDHKLGCLLTVIGVILLSVTAMIDAL